MNPANIDLAPLMLSLAHVVAGVLVLVIAKLLRGVLSPYRTDEEMTAKDNPAFGLAAAGYYLAVAAIYIGAFRSVPAAELGTVGALRLLAENLIWALGGMVALAFSRWLMNRFLISCCSRSGGMRSVSCLGHRAGRGAA
jgi:hypothetical protein